MKIKPSLESESSIQRKCIALIRSLDSTAFHLVNAQSKSKSTVGQQMAAIKEGFIAGQSDIIINRICYDVATKTLCKGMFLELKKEGSKIYKKDGTFVNKHIEKQNKYMQKYGKDYFCNFGIGYDHAEKIIKHFYTFVEVDFSTLQTLFEIKIRNH